MCRPRRRQRPALSQLVSCRCVLAESGRSSRPGARLRRRCRAPAQLTASDRKAAATSNLGKFSGAMIAAIRLSLRDTGFFDLAEADVVCAVQTGQGIIMLARTSRPAADGANHRLDQSATGRAVLVTVVDRRRRHSSSACGDASARGSWSARWTPSASGVYSASVQTSSPSALTL